MPLLPFSRKCQKDKFSDQILALIRLAGEWAALALFLELYAAAREVQTPSAQMRYVCVLPGTFCKSKDRSEQIFYNPADPFGFKVRRRRVSLEVYANYLVLCYCKGNGFF
jgi:hypothetical protein